MSNIIQGLWIGDSLSTMEQLSISSFLKNNHEYHLYTYNDIKNIPEGTIVKDGNEIIPKDNIFYYKRGGSPSAFSNMFRYKLLYDKGGYWVDTDMVCLHHFDFEDDYVFSRESKSQITSSVIKAPKNSPAMKEAYEYCCQVNKDTLRWGHIGPHLVDKIVKKYKLEKYTKETNTFCPIHYNKIHTIFSKNSNENIIEIKEKFKEFYGLHLWNELWRKYRYNKDKIYDKSCMYEILKQIYL